MKRYLTLILAVLAFAVAASAQDVARWAATVKMTSAKEGVVTLTADIDKGWHVYGLTLPDGGPKPTTIAFDKSTGIALKGAIKPAPAPKEHHDAAFNMKLTWWEGKVTFTQKFKVTDPNAAKIVINLRYMACNDENCRPPKRQTIELDVPKYKKGKK